MQASLVLSSKNNLKLKIDGLFNCKNVKPRCLKLLPGLRINLSKSRREIANFRKSIGWTMPHLKLISVSPTIWSKESSRNSKPFKASYSEKSTEFDIRPNEWNIFISIIWSIGLLHSLDFGRIMSTQHTYWWFISTNWLAFQQPNDCWDFSNLWNKWWISSAESTIRCPRGDLRTNHIQVTSWHPTEIYWLMQLMIFFPIYQRIDGE